MKPGNRCSRAGVLFGVALILLPVAGAALADAVVGRTKLVLPGGTRDVVIEDVSPDRGSTAEGASTHYATPWGLTLAISRSGKQLTASPATGWIAENGPVYVDHVGTVDTNGRLLAFFWSPLDEAHASQTDSAAWKVVDVSEKTAVLAAVEQPASWQIRSAGLLQERLAARDRGGRIHVFSWSPGQDWAAETVDPTASPRFEGPLTAWANDSAGKAVESVAGRTDTGALVLYSRAGGGAWSKVDVTGITKRSISGDPQGWRIYAGSERIAAHDAAQHLWLFSATSSSNWSALDLTSATGGHAALGPVAGWDRGGAQHIAARAPSGDLLVFNEDPIESQWRVENLSSATGVQVGAPPVHWETSNGERIVTHIAAPDPQGHIRIFWRQDDDPWKVVDVTALTGVSTPHRLAAWATPREGGGLIEHLAAPTATGYLHVFSWQPGSDWSAVDVTTRAAGRAVYVATPWAGVFVSRDYGVEWQQSTRPQPGITDTSVPFALPVPRILDVAVAPDNPDLVFAAADREGRGYGNARVTSAGGVYRSEDGGKTWSLSYTFTCGNENRPVTQIEIAPDDPKRVYAAGYCGIARSANGGKSWDLLTPPGANEVYHLAVSGRRGRMPEDRILVACGPSGVWFSRKDGATGSWITDQATAALPDNFCGKTDFQYVNESAAEVLALDPENPEHVYYAHHSWANGPSYYHPAQLGPEGVSCNIPVLYDGDDDRLTDAGEIWIWRHRQMPPGGSALGNDRRLRFVDLDGDGAWTADLNGDGVANDGEPVYYDANANGQLDKDEPLIAGTAQAEGTPLLADRRIRYLTGGYGGYDPGFGPRRCGEGSLWRGDFSAASFTNPRAVWAQLPGPPVYYVGWSNGSGSTMVRTVATAKGHLVLFTDSGTLHVAKGPPTAGGWHRLDGVSASEAKGIGLAAANIAVHADPRGLDVSEDFDLDLKATSQGAPYHLSSELKSCLGGRVWLSNDGGVYANADCGEVDSAKQAKNWQATESGLHALWLINVLGATGSKLTAEVPRALYTGTTHDDDFFTIDDGKTWRSARGACGDCDAWFGDLYQRKRVMRLDPRNDAGKGELSIFENLSNAPPDAAAASQHTAFKNPEGARKLTVSSEVIRGSRLVIQSLPSETPPAKGDYLVIVERAGVRTLRRAHGSLDASATDTGFLQVGPDLPAGVTTAQAAGGHADPVFFLGDGSSLWRGDEDAQGHLQWQPIVPSATAQLARRFFVDPWRPEIVYLIDDAAVRRSVDAGDTWQVDQELTDAVSGKGEWRFACQDVFCLLNDMAFDPLGATRRFAAGVAGVFYTAGGARWTRLLDTRSLPSRPLSLWFDPLTEPANDVLVVGTMGRGVLRLSPIPDDDPFRPVEWLALPSSGTKKNWLPTAPGHHLIWHTAGAAAERRLDRSERTLGGQTRVLVLGDGLAEGSGQTTLPIPCDGLGRRLVFRWRALQVEGREVPAALDLSLGDAEGTQVVVATLGAELSNGSWRTETMELAQSRCGSLRLSFCNRVRGDDPVRFEIGELRLERWSE